MICPAALRQRTQFRKRNLNFPKIRRTNLKHSIITTVPGDVDPAINRGAQHYALVIISMISEELDPTRRKRSGLASSHSER